MMLNHFYITGALLLYLIGTILACYRDGFTFTDALGDKQISGLLDTFCTNKAGQEYHSNDDIKLCQTGKDGHLDIEITITELSFNTLYFSSDACHYILDDTMSAINRLGCTQGGRDIEFSYQASSKRNAVDPSIDEEHQDTSGYEGEDENTSDDVEENGDTSGGKGEADDISDDEGEDEHTSDSDFQGGNGEYTQEPGGIPGAGSTTTVISSVNTTVTDTTLSTSTTSRQKHKTSGSKKHKTETATRTTKTTKTITSTAITTQTVMVSSSTIQTITTFISTSSISTDSSGRTNVYFKGKVRIDPQSDPCS